MPEPRPKSLVTVLRELVRDEVTSTLASLLSASKPKAKNAGVGGEGNGDQVDPAARRRLSPRRRLRRVRVLPVVRESLRPPKRGVGLTGGVPSSLVRGRGVSA